MVIELPIITDVLSQPDRTGRRKTLIKNKIVNKLFDLNEIDVEEFIDIKTGKTIKKYTAVYIKEDCYKINKPYDEMKDLVINRTYPVKGFMAHSIKYKGK